MKRGPWAAIPALGVICLAGPSGADLVCPDASYCTVSFSRTYSGDYRRGASYDVVTIAPDAAGETFARTGITIRVYLRACQGVPLAGVPKETVILFNSSLCLCPGGNIADHDSDANGVTEFTGTIRGGGCANRLTVFADGVAAGSIAVQINSPDRGYASPCFVDSSDLASMVTHFPAQIGQADYTICLDFNEDGHFDASDLAFWASHRGAACP